MDSSLKDAHPTTYDVREPKNRVISGNKVARPSASLDVKNYNTIVFTYDIEYHLDSYITTMYSLTQSFSFVLKEKNTFLKILIPLTIATLYSASNTLYTVLGFKEDGEEITILFFPLLLLFLIFVFLNAAISLWYSYENIQTGMYERESRGIWQDPFWDTIKKISKLFTLNLILAIPIILVLTPIVILCIVLLVVLLPLGILVTGVLGLLSMIGLFMYSALFMLPSQLRMISTNTFSDGLRASENYAIGRKYWKEFLVATLIVFGISFALGFVIGFISGFITAIAGSSFDPVGVIISAIATYPLTLFSMYVTAFMIPHLFGTLYGNIMQQEGTR